MYNTRKYKVFLLLIAIIAVSAFVDLSPKKCLV